MSKVKMYYSHKEVCAVLNTDSRVLAKLRREGIIPCIHDGRAYLYPIKEILDYRTKMEHLKSLITHENV